MQIGRSLHLPLQAKSSTPSSSTWPAELSARRAFCSRSLKNSLRGTPRKSSTECWGGLRFQFTMSNNKPQGERKLPGLQPSLPVRCRLSCRDFDVLLLAAVLLPFQVNMLCVFHCGVKTRPQGRGRETEPCSATLKDANGEAFRTWLHSCIPFHSCR